MIPLDIEEWRTCIYDGITYKDYEVSNLGYVRSLNYRRTGQTQILKPHERTDGYLDVTLHNDNTKKICYIHRLVAEVFIPNPDNKPTVNHIDENPKNNHVSNLEWADMNEQVHHGTRTERQRKAMQGKRVKCVETNIIYDSARDAERETGIKNANIGAVCKGKRQTAVGYHWEFVD